MLRVVERWDDGASDEKTTQISVSKLLPVHVCTLVRSALPAEPRMQAHAVAVFLAKLFFSIGSMSLSIRLSSNGVRYGVSGNEAPQISCPKLLP